MSGRDAVAQSLRVELGERSYDIAIHSGYDCLDRHLASFAGKRRLYVIADEQVAALYADRVLKAGARSAAQVELLTFPAGEGSKTLPVLAALSEELVRLRADRSSLILALGGGVTGDLAGFVAATYMRGIPFVQLPTSLLAMVDSSVGGKTGVNLACGKNLVGAFHQPLLVYSALESLQTLPAVELRNGMAEVIKHGCIADAMYFRLVEDGVADILGLDPRRIADVVLGSCRIKAAVVAEDEREAGRRAALNFGHTAGHALEAVTGYGSYRHGEAVSVGMVVAARLGERICGFPREETERLAKVLEAFSLPTSCPGVQPEDLLEAMFADKKTTHDRLRYVVPLRLGEVRIESVRDTAPVLEALQSVCVT